jgi:hypothetical protein
MQFSAWSQGKISTNDIPPHVVRGQLYGISVDWSQTVSLPLHGGSAGISLLLQTMVKLAIATGHAMQVLMICIIQIDAGLLAWHDQLPW